MRYQATIMAKISIPGRVVETQQANLQSSIMKDIRVYTGKGYRPLSLGAYIWFLITIMIRFTILYFRLIRKVKAI